MKNNAAFRDLLAVVADGFHRASVHGLFAKRFFGRIFGLLVEIAVTAIIIAFVIRRCRLTAQVTINALVIHVEFPLHVFRIFVRLVCHIKGRAN